MIEIDGSAGEGGGQIVRTALALALVTGRAFRLRNLRARRPKPGLMRQHLAAVEAARRVGAARVEGAVLGSREIVFAPGPIAAGKLTLSVGSAGSATLVLQTVLPALLTAPVRSELVLEGGTHNPLAPPFEFIRETFLPIVSAMGPGLEARLERPGFYPAGGGRFTVSVEPVARLAPLELVERGGVRRIRARAIVSRLSPSIGERELRAVGGALGAPVAGTVDVVEEAAGPGNAVLVAVECERLTEVFSAFGRRGVRAEEVGADAGRQARRYLDSGVPVGEHLADQLLIPLALAGRGRFRAAPLSLHARTQLETIRLFLERDFRVGSSGPGGVEVSLA